MVFKRIDKDTVRCILSEQDMIDNGLEIEDFFKDKDKIHDFLETIVEQAREEVGYEMKTGMLAMQVMPLPNRGLAITFSENADTSFNNMLEQLKELANGEVILPEEELENEKLDKRLKKLEGRLFQFETFADVEKFCQSVSLEKVAKSVLYKKEENGKYYMIIRKGKMARKVYECLCFSALEYASLVSDDIAVLVYWQEHEKPMVKKNAIGIIKTMCRG